MNTVIRVNARGEFDDPMGDEPLQALRLAIRAERPNDCEKTETGCMIQVLRMAAKELETTDVWIAEFKGTGARFGFIRSNVVAGSNARSQTILHNAMHNTG